MAYPVTTFQNATPAAVGRGKAQRIYTIFKDYETLRTDWAMEAANDEDFFFGNQWTQSQIYDLGEKGMAPLVVNRTMPVIMQEVSMFTAKRPTFRALPREDMDVAKAGFWTDVFDYIWYISNGDSEFQQCIRDYFVMGLGYMCAFIDPMADDGRGEVKVESVPVWDVYPDPNCRKIDFSDARSICVSRRIDVDTLLMMYPHKRRAILRADSEMGSGSDRPGSNPGIVGQYLTPDTFDYVSAYSGSQSRKLRTIDCYEKILEPYVRVYYLSNGAVQEIPAEKWNKALESSPNLVVENFYKTRVKLTQTLGSSTVLHELVLPCAEYPIVPFVLHHARTPFPIGDVSIIKGMQVEINKRRSIMIHNASLSGNSRFMSEEGAIKNEADFERRGARAGYLLKYRKGYEKPEQLHPAPLPNAFIQLEGEAKQDLEYAVSVFAHMMGSSQDAPETYRALLALEEAGQKKIQHKALHARHSLRVLGKVVLQLSQAVYQRPKLMRIVGEDNVEMKTIWMNKLQIDPLSGEMQTINDAKVGSFDIVVNDGTSMPTNRMALLNLYLEMFQLGIIDRTEVIKKTDIRDRDGLLDRMGEIQQLQSELNSAYEENKNLAGLNQTLRRQSQQLEIHLGAERGLETTRDQVRQTTMEQRLARARVGDALQTLSERIKIQEQKLGLDAKELLSKMNLEREKQRAMNEVQNARRTE